MGIIFMCINGYNLCGYNYNFRGYNFCEVVNVLPCKLCTCEIFESMKNKSAKLVRREEHIQTRETSITAYRCCPTDAVP